MKITRLAIPDVILFEPKVFGDDRGFFFESFSQRLFAETTGLKYNFVQDNHSKSKRGVLRGLHYQLPPKAQGKLVRVVRGAVFDVAVDIRKTSPTFGKWVGTELTEANFFQIWIPPGFAHGFVALTDSVEFLYKTTDYYSLECERCLIWNDPVINIAWPISDQPNLSVKDSQGKILADAELFS